VICTPSRWHDLQGIYPAVSSRFLHRSAATVLRLTVTVRGFLLIPQDAASRDVWAFAARTLSAARSDTVFGGSSPQLSKPLAVAQRILIVEDEGPIAESIAHTLRREGFETRIACDGETALRLAEGLKPDLVVLDLMLPGMGGLDVCRVLRRHSTVPIIMLTARAEEVDRVLGLEMGADDYVTKPFSMRELVARVRATLRRQEMLAQSADQPRFEDERLVIDLAGPSVEVEGSPVALTPREYSLLRVLLIHRGRARTRQQLLDEAWGSDQFIDPRTVDVHIRWLRQKLEPDPEHPAYIETIRGIGYRFSK